MLKRDSFGNLFAFKISLSYFATLNRKTELINNDPIYNLLSDYSEIEHIMEIDLPEKMKYFYFNRNKINEILYEKDKVIEINLNLIQNKLSEYFYLTLLFESNKNNINFVYSYNFIKDINEKIKGINDYALREMIMSKFFLELINNYKGTKEFYDNDNQMKNEINDLEILNKKRIESSVKKINNLEINAKDIINKKIDQIYIGIFIDLIKSKNIFDNNIAHNIMKELDFENINITKTMFEELANILKSDNDYMKQYIIFDKYNLFDKGIIDFYYILSKYILKKKFYIYQIPFLVETRKKIIKIIKENIIKENDEKFKYIVNFFTDFLKLNNLVKKLYNIQIYIKLISNKTLALDVLSSNTIKNIKEIIKDKEGIPLEEQNLISSGKRLLDDKTLEYYDIKNESIIYLFLKIEIIQIFIQEYNGKIIILDDVMKRNTIGNIKIRILAKEGIIPDQYKLIFSGTELEDNRELNYYNIQNESNIQLIPVKFKIFVDYLNIKKIEIDVEYSDTIVNIKQKIECKEENLPNYYRLTFDTMELENNLTLKDYNIEKNCTINLVKINIIQIFVENLNRKKIFFEVDYSDTIENIKEKILFKEEIFSYKCKLLFEGINLENNKTLKEYNINENSIIYLQYYKDIKIFIEMNEQIIELNAKTSDTILDIKSKLDKSISLNKIKLIFDGIKLEDEKTLENYNISNNSIIYLQYYRKFEILIVNEEKKISLKVEENERIINIKNKIKKLERIPPYEYKLQFEGKKLEEYRNIEDYNLNNGCIIYLIYCQFIQIYVRTLSGKYITVYAQESETISYIKEKIEYMTKISVYGQLLIYNGKYLEDNKTLSDYNIQEHNSIEFLIHLSLRLRGGH